MPRFSRLALCFLAVVCALPLIAQTTGSLSGVVMSEGNPLPGVTVTVSSPQLQGTRTAVSGDAGGYSFPSLPPGTYKVRFELAGMAPVEKHGSVQLSQPLKIDADLKVSSVTEAITVTAEAPAVLETTGVATSFNQEQISKLPVGRNIRDTTLLAPGVNPNGVNRQITINGGPSYDNIFMVNGVVVNENLRGQPHNLFIEDAIQETTVVTTGISAEYGRFTGGVVNTLTKSGGNEFTGSFRDSFTNPNWTETPDFPNAADPIDKTNQVYEATLGGRVIRDRLWFFAAGRKAKTATARSTFRTNIAFANGFDEKRYEGKLTAAITSNHNIVGSYLDVKNVESNNFFPSIYDEASIVESRSLPNKLSSVQYNGIFGSNLVVEANWSEKEFAFINSGGRFTDRIKGTWIQDSVTAVRMNAPVFCGVCTPEERNSGGKALKGTYFLSTRSLGNHSIAVGADRFEETRIVNNYQSASNFNILGRVIDNTFTGYESIGSKVYPRFDSTTTLTWTPIFTLSNGTDLSSDAFFVNDKWDLNNRLSFNLGVRYDANDAVDADGEQISDDSNISPRLGLNWDIMGTGKHRLTANYARYATKIGDGSNVFSTAQGAGSPGAFTWTYAGPAVNAPGTPVNQLVPADQALAILFAWFDSIGGTANTNFTSSSYPGFGSIFRESLQTPYADEMTVGYGMQVTPRAALRLDVVHREWGNFYGRQVNEPNAFITAPNGAKSDMSVTVNDNDYTERTYNAVELQGNWSPMTSFSIGGNYTWSKLRGNDVSEGAGTATIRNTPGEIFYPQYLSYDRRRPVGYLNQDRRHRARLWASYDLSTPIGSFAISGIESYDSGFSYEAIGGIDATGRNANFRACTATITTMCFNGLAANPGYNFSAAGTTHDYFFSDRGAYHTEARLGTDLALLYTTPSFGKVSAFVRGDVLNVFNTNVIVDPSQLNTDVITSRTGLAPVLNPDGTVKTINSGLRPFNPFTDTPKECPQGNTPQQCYDMGANWQKGLNFGKPNSTDALQIADRALAPRTYRLSVGFKF
ncbi:MAG TPA: TonB-dependent receptor [Thermoanaerobaculia bacterium]|nr:TonB-dependent receptor [Thermoanaerobaculia bacterium]